ncbi:MAG TPA: hypothetical protein VGJ60_20505 [Chloroflexota bacterium]|jgi:hypothetical protein
MPDFNIDEMPTFNDMVYWRDHLQAQWGDLDQEQEAEADLYFQAFDVESPGGRLAVKTGSAPSDADAAIDSLVPPDVSVHVRPARAREKYRKQADKLTRFGKAMLYSWRRRKDFVRQIATDMVIQRVGVGRVMVDRTLWPEKPGDLRRSEQPPERAEEESEEAYEARVSAFQEDDEEDAWEVRHRRKNPIVWQRRDPRIVRWRESDEGELLVVVEHYQTSVIEAQAAWLKMYPEGVREATRGMDPDEDIWVDDVWRGRWRCLILNDIPLFPVGGDGIFRGVVDHGYPEIPYLIAPFRELTFDDMERRYRGMLTNAAGLYPIESNVLTMQVWMLAINAWRTYLGWTKDGREIQIRPGQYIPMDQRIGEYLQMLEGQPVPDELLRTTAVMDSYIQRNGVAQGPRSAEGTRSAQQLWAVQSMRTLKIESAKDSLTRMLQRSLEIASMELELMLGDRLTLPVPGKTKDGEDMGEVTVKPEDIDGYWEGFEVSLGRRLDPALLEQWKALQALQANKWIPHRQSIELSGATDNPQEWLDELVREAVDSLPFVIEQVGLERVKNWFGEDSERFIALSQKLLAQQQSQTSPLAPQGGTIQPPAAGGPSGGGVALPAQSPLGQPPGRPPGNDMAAATRPKQARSAGSPTRATPAGLGGTRPVG